MYHTANPTRHAPVLARLQTPPRVATNLLYTSTLRFLLYSTLPSRMLLLWQKFGGAPEFG